MQFIVYKGFFLVPSAKAVGEARFMGLCSICVEQPSPQKGVRPFDTVTTPIDFPDETKALQEVERQARKVVDSLLPPNAWVNTA